jgi:RNA exonuclease 1
MSDQRRPSWTLTRGGSIGRVRAGSSADTYIVLRYSGIKEPDMQLESIVDLPEARRRMASFMTPQTVLVGHGLENDLKALRLVHLQVADSALIYKHRKGLPFRLSLRELTLTHLGKKIQVEDASLGHDPEEDARAALE